MSFIIGEGEKNKMWILDTVGENIRAAVFAFLSAWSTFLLGRIEFFYEPKPSQSPEPLEVPVCLFLPQSG